MFSPLDREQQKVASSQAPTLQVRAAPGTGKTRTIAARIVRFIRRGVDPSEIIFITSTRRAAEKMKGRVRSELNDPSVHLDGLHIGSWYSVCAKILTDSFHLESSIADQQYRISLMERASKKAYGKVVPGEAINSLDSIRKRKSGGKESNQLVFIRYQEMLQRRDLIDHEDLILKTCEHLEMDRGSIGAIKAVFVDEYEDVSPVQAKLLKILGGSGCISVFGDPMETIASSRSASPSVFKNMVRQYGDVKKLQLKNNHRSTPEILRLADDVLKGAYPSHGYQNSTLPGGSPVKYGMYMNFKEESVAIAEEVCFLHEWRETVHVNKWSDIAILVHKKTQIRPLLEALRGLRVPVKVLDGTTFWEAKETMLIFALVKVVVSNKDWVSYVRVMSFFCPEVDAEDYFERCSKGDLYQCISELAENNDNAKEIMTIVEKARNLTQGGGDMEAHCLNVLDYLLECITQFKHWKGCVQNILCAGNFICDQVLDLANTHVHSSLSSLFTDAVGSLMLEHPDYLDDDEDKVTITTINRAKGLEWEVVFVPDVDPGIYPLSSSDTAAKVRNDYRCLYVAMTRACKQLYLTMTYDRIKPGPVLPFLAGLETGPASENDPWLEVVNMKLFAHKID